MLGKWYEQVWGMGKGQVGISMLVTGALTLKDAGGNGSLGFLMSFGSKFKYLLLFVQPNG